MSLGSNISFLRKQKKLTQEQFSERMNVTRQTVSRWESDEVIPELDRLIEMCSLFSCNLDALVRENLAEQSGIYSKIKIRRVAPFRMASYVMITPEPENDVLDYMERWAEKSGLKQMCSEVKIIGWDFPFVSQEQKHRFGLRGYAAASLLPENFKTSCCGVRYSENKEADYVVITIKEPFIQPFERIPNAYKLLLEYINANNIRGKHQEDILSCFEYEYQKNGTTFMDVFIHVDGVKAAEPFAFVI